MVFAEVHNDPDNAPSDGPNMLHLETFENFVKEIRKWFDDSSELTRKSEDHPELH